MHGVFSDVHELSPVTANGGYYPLVVHRLLLVVGFLVEQALRRVGSVVFFFFSFIFISWRLITLQYCSGFCHTLT